MKLEFGFDQNGEAPRSDSIAASDMALRDRCVAKIKSASPGCGSIANC